MRALLRAELTRAGRIVAVRAAPNSVMQAGAELVARCFAGDGTGITHMAVGTSDAAESEDFTTEELANDPPLGGETEAPLDPGAFTITTDSARRVAVVRVRGTLPSSSGVGTIREAGLLSRRDDTALLYNRVTFAPLDKGAEHELTLFWEVTFPYGDLQWL